MPEDARLRDPYGLRSLLDCPVRSLAGTARRTAPASGPGERRATGLRAYEAFLDRVSDRAPRDVKTSPATFRTWRAACRRVTRARRAPEGVHEPVERQVPDGPVPGLHLNLPALRVDLRGPAAHHAHTRASEELLKRPPLHGGVPGGDLVHAGALYPHESWVDEGDLYPAALGPAGGAPGGEEPRVSAAQDDYPLGTVRAIAPISRTVPRRSGARPSHYDFLMPHLVFLSSPCPTRPGRAPADLPPRHASPS